MKRNQAIIVLLLFSTSFGIYLKTLAPTIVGGDSGELIANAYTLGIAHPTGSPLYCLLGRLFTLLPFGSIAYRVNLMSAFFASLTVVLVYLIILKIQDPGSRIQDPQTSFLRHVPAIVASLCLAFSKSFWSYALIAEVYILQAFFLALLIFILLKWKESCSQPAEGEVSPLRGGRPATGDRRLATCNRYLSLFALIYGLSFSNHITTVLFFPAFLYFLLVTDWRVAVNPKNIILVILTFTLGLSLYLYLPIRSLQNPALDWGDPENLRNFIDHVTGKQYHFRLFDLPVNKVPFQIKRYALMLFEEFIWLPLVIGLFGLGYLVARNKRLLLLTGLIFLLPTAFNLSQFEIEMPSHLYIPSYFIFSLWIGLGMGGLLSFYSRFQTKTSSAYLLSFLLLLIPLAPASAHYSKVNQSKNFATYDWTRGVLEAIEKDALLICEYSFPFWYLKYGEGERSDVIEITPMFFAHRQPWYLRQLKERYPFLSLVPREEEVKRGQRIKNREFIYPAPQELIESIKKKLEEEGELKEGKEIPSRQLIASVVLRYLIPRNPDHPIYLFRKDDPAIPPSYHLIYKGLFYEVRKERPSLVVKNPKIEHKMETNFSDQLIFLGYNIRETTLPQGGLYHVTYYWKILKEPHNPPKVLVFFTDEEGNFEVENGLPKFHQVHFLGHGLPPNYHEGETIAEEYALVLPAHLSPGTYDIHLGVLDVDQDLALTVEGEPLLRIGKIEVMKRKRRWE